MMPISRHSPSHDFRNYALAILLGVNLLNYIDRQVRYAVFPLIKADLNVSDAALGMLGSAFMIRYMSSAPLLGAPSAISREAPSATSSVGTPPSS